MRKLKEFDYVVQFAMFNDPRKVVTIADVMDRYGWTHGKARRCLERLREHGSIKRRQWTFWNGMYYATRFYYW